MTMEVIKVYDSRATEDIFTYGPLDVIKIILLGMDLKEYIHTCGINRRIREMCKQPNFQKLYFDRHSNEVLARFDEILSYVRTPSESDILFMREWLHLIDESTMRKYNHRDLPRWKGLDGLFGHMTATTNQEMMKIVLDDPRFDPSKSNIIEWIIMTDHSNLVERLLKDPRFVPIEENLSLAILEENADIVKLLLKDGRIVPSGDLLIQAARNKYKGMVKLLLEDGRIDVAETLDSLKHKKGSKKICRFIKKILNKLPKKKLRDKK